MRFSIDRNTDHTPEEVAKQLDVTRERIRQTEAKAQRKPGHPTRSDKLRSFLDSEEASTDQFRVAMTAIPLGTSCAILGLLASLRAFQQALHVKRQGCTAENAEGKLASSQNTYIPSDNRDSTAANRQLGQSSPTWF